MQPKRVPPLKPSRLVAGAVALVPSWFARISALPLPLLATVQYT
jgi:hypothetical protein